MRVRCEKLLDPEANESTKTDGWLRIGAEYVVLSVHCDRDGWVKFQLLCDEGGVPAFHDSNQFAIVSDDIPSCWKIDFAAGSHFELTPRAWAMPGFWERYFDGEVDAVAVFESEIKKLFDEGH